MKVAVSQFDGRLWRLDQGFMIDLVMKKTALVLMKPIRLSQFTETKFAFIIKLI